jgi:hypothetical protein
MDGESVMTLIGLRLLVHSTRIAERALLLHCAVGIVAGRKVTAGVLKSAVSLFSCQGG